MSNATRSTFATSACYVCPMDTLVAPLAGSGQIAFFNRLLSLAAIDVIKHVANMANSYLVLCVPYE
jgi:hypothetical protein